MDCQIDKQIEINVDTKANENFDANNDTNEEVKEGEKDNWGYAVCFGTVITFVSIYPFIYIVITKDVKRSTHLAS